MIYRGVCWYTYDLGVTYKLGGTDRYVGYTGYKRCSPFLKNPIVEIYADGGIVVYRTAVSVFTSAYISTR